MLSIKGNVRDYFFYFIILPVLKQAENYNFISTARVII